MSKKLNCPLLIKESKMKPNEIYFELLKDVEDYKKGSFFDPMGGLVYGLSFNGLKIDFPNKEFFKPVTKPNTVKIAEIKEETCLNPEHNPPSHMVFDSGVYQHTCPGCGKVQTFTVNNHTLA